MLTPVDTVGMGLIVDTPVDTILFLPGLVPTSPIPLFGKCFCVPVEHVLRTTGSVPIFCVASFAGFVPVEAVRRTIGSLPASCVAPFVGFVPVLCVAAFFGVVPVLLVIGLVL